MEKYLGIIRDKYKILMKRFICLKWFLKKIPQYHIFSSITIHCRSLPLKYTALRVSLKFFLNFQTGSGTGYTEQLLCLSLLDYSKLSFEVFLLHSFTDLTATELIVYKMVILHQVRIINLKIKVCVLLLLRDFKILLES